MGEAERVTDANAKHLHACRSNRTGKRGTALAPSQNATRSKYSHAALPAPLEALVVALVRTSARLPRAAPRDTA